MSDKNSKFDNIAYIHEMFPHRSPTLLHAPLTLDEDAKPFFDMIISFLNDTLVYTRELFEQKDQAELMRALEGIVIGLTRVERSAMEYVESRVRAEERKRPCRIDPSMIGTALRIHRKSKNISPEALSEKTGIPSNRLEDFEAGIAIPTVEEAISIGTQYGIHYEEIFKPGYLYET